MKKFSICLLVALMASISVNVFAQNQDFKYRRSSLAMVLVDVNSFDNKDVVMNTWNNYPFPDKYDKHDIPFKTLQLDSASLDIQGIVNLITGKSDMQAAIDKAIKENKIGNQLVAKWFDRSAEGKFDTKLIEERGFYNATELDVEIANQSVRKTAALADAGQELLNNTFVSFTQFMFFKNEPIASLILGTALAAAKTGNPLVDAAAQKGAEVVYNKTKDGQTLFSKTWLYKLVWSEEVEAKFYDVWDNSEAFDKLDFQLELVGVQNNSSIIVYASEGVETAIQKVEVRNIDKVFAELQQKYDVFKPKVPVLTNEPLTAQIGMKESLKGGEKFEVLEMTQDATTGRTKYERVGTTKVDKKLVWDNRYNAGEKPEVETLDKNGTPITATTFKSVKKAQPGMLLKQIK